MNPFQFLKEVRQQVKHISWPDTKTVVKLSITVILVSVIGAVILGGFDVFFAKGFAEISKSTTPPVDPNSLLENVDIQSSTPSAELDQLEATPSSQTSD